MIPKITVKVRAGKQIATLGNLKISDTRMMRTLGMTAAARIKLRTTRGRGAKANGAESKLEGYSTQPIWMPTTISANSRLKAKGGKRSKSGKTMFFKGGYKQFKKKATGSSKVNYIASGITLNAMRVLQATKRRAVIGFSTGEAKAIASGLQGRGTPFFVLSKKDIKALVRVAAVEVQRLINAAEN